jgi:natural product biosynthesis luciferase-like monooxygenase protein
MKNVEDIYPLTQAQADLLRESLAAHSPARIHWRLAGEFDSSAFESAWQKALARHTALRACFLSEGLERPVQVIRRQVKLLYERHDLSGLEPDEGRDDYEAPLSPGRCQDFNLARPPLFRLVEIDLGAGERELVVEHHPLLFDGRSAELLMAEALAVYGAWLRGAEIRLAPAVPFRAYADWVERQDLAVAEFYWRKALRGAEGAPRPGVRANGHGDCDAPAPIEVSRANLKAEATAGILAYARRRGISVETLVDGAWAFALMRERGSREEIVGALVGARAPSLPASETIIGRIENALPLRVSYERGESLMSFLEKIGRQRAELERFGHVSASQIKRWLRMDAGARIFDNEVYTRAAPREAEVAGLHVGARGRHEATTGSPLALEATLGDELSLTLRTRRGYATGALSARLLEGVIEALRCLTFPIVYLSSASREGEPEPQVVSSEARRERSEDVERVEAALRRHPAVREMAVVGPGQGAEGCVAYVVLDDRHKPARPLDFSLFYFADDNAALGDDKYRLYLEGAKFADRHGFAAVWTPERHFHEKAGLYPNPSVLSAALATITERVGLRAGSVVLPLHNSLRVAEEWSVIDNLSRGRAGVSFTSGWMPNDFAFYPERYANKREEMFRGIEEVRGLWRGRPLAGRDGMGKEIELRIFPKPIQPELPMWLTCSGDPKMFERAGALGCHVLTALLAQSLEDAVPNIQLYRESLERHGHDPATGKVTMMMHTFVSEDQQSALEKARAPLTNYLKSHVNLIESGAESLKIQVDLSEEEYRAKYLDQLAAFAFERYYRTASLIGAPASCLKMIDRLRAAGVDEVACLIDFGIDVDATLESLTHLLVLKEMCDAASEADASRLDKFVKAELPDYRGPIKTVALDALPRAATGALDHAALPAARW